MRLVCAVNVFAYVKALPPDKLILQAIAITSVTAAGRAVIFLRAVANRQRGANVARFL